MTTCWCYIVSNDAKHLVLKSLKKWIGKKHIQGHHNYVETQNTKLAITHQLSRGEAMWIRWVFLLPFLSVFLVPDHSPKIEKIGLAVTPLSGVSCFAVFCEVCSFNRTSPSTGWLYKLWSPEGIYFDLKEKEETCWWMEAGCWLLKTPLTTENMALSKASLPLLLLLGYASLCIINILSSQ